MSNRPQLKQDPTDLLTAGGSPLVGPGPNWNCGGMAVGHSSGMGGGLWLRKRSSLLLLLECSCSADFSANFSFLASSSLSAIPALLHASSIHQWYSDWSAMPMCFCLSVIALAPSLSSPRASSMIFPSRQPVSVSEASWPLSLLCQQPLR